jgi:predicted transposase YbfD/YdcC
MKKLILIALSLFCTTASFAQNGERMRERVKAQKIAFITDKLDLTPEEATKFWPIYNAAEERIEAVRTKDMRSIKSKIRQNPEMSDDEANKLLQDLIKAEDEMYKAKVDLINNLKGVIPAKKIIRLKRAEDEFNQKLLERLREMRKKRGKPRN